MSISLHRTCPSSPKISHRMSPSITNIFLLTECLPPHRISPSSPIYFTRTVLVHIPLLRTSSHSFPPLVQPYIYPCVHQSTFPSIPSFTVNQSPPTTCVMCIPPAPHYTTVIIFPMSLLFFPNSAFQSFIFLRKYLSPVPPPLSSAFPSHF